MTAPTDPQSGSSLAPPPEAGSSQSSPCAPTDAALLEIITAMGTGDMQALAELVGLAGPWLLPVAQRLCGDDPKAAADLCEQLFVQVWQLSPCYDANLGPPLAWMLLLLRELAGVAAASGGCSYPADSGGLARLWFGEVKASDGA